VDGFNKTFAGFHSEIVGQPGQHFAPSVFRSRVGQQAGRTEFQNLRNWGDVLNLLAGSQVFQNVEFLKMLDVKEGLEKDVAPRFGAYELRRGRTYTLRVFQIVPNPSPGSSSSYPHDIQLNSFSEQIQILRRPQRAVGKYDVLSFVFKVADVPYGEQTALELRQLAPEESVAAAVRNPVGGAGGFYIPIVIQPPSAAERAIRLTGLVVGLLLIFVPILSGIDAPIAVSVGTISFILTVAGWRQLGTVLPPFAPGRRKTRDT
jgi:hypothetical protein